MKHYLNRPPRSNLSIPFLIVGILVPVFSLGSATPDTGWIAFGTLCISMGIGEWGARTTKRSRFFRLLSLVLATIIIIGAVLQMI